MILKGNKVDLGKFPILQWSPADGGAYITLPLVIAKDDKFGPNAGIYRMMVHDKKSTGIMCNIFQDQGIYYDKSQEKRPEEHALRCGDRHGPRPLYGGRDKDSSEMRTSSPSLPRCATGRLSMWSSVRPWTSKCRQPQR